MPAVLAFVRSGRNRVLTLGAVLEGDAVILRQKLKIVNPRGTARLAILVLLLPFEVILLLGY